jgi:5-formyltetrahydrofolate cyclo-ligase
MTKDDQRKQAFAIRKAAHAARDGRDERAQDYLATMIGHFSGKVLSGYMPIRTEIDPHPAMAVHDGPLCVPVVEAAGQPLAFRRWSAGCAMIPGAFGAPIPADETPLTPEVLIVPLLAFDRRGYRLGYGGGFYDRTLEALRARGPVTAIGFAYAAQERHDLLLEPTDQPLDLIVTDHGILQV